MRIDYTALNLDPLSKKKLECIAQMVNYGSVFKDIMGRSHFIIFHCTMYFKVLEIVSCIHYQNGLSKNGGSMKM